MIRKRFSARGQLLIIVAALLAFGVWGIWYKVSVLGYALTPGAESQAWLLEAEVSFTATGEEVKVSLTVPDESPGYKVLSEEQASVGYGFAINTLDGDRRAEWTRREATGPQKLFYRINVFDVVGAPVALEAPAPPKPEPPLFEEPAATAAASIVEAAWPTSSDPVSFAGQIVRMLNQPDTSSSVGIFLEDITDEDTRVGRTLKLLALKGVPGRIARGVNLKDGQRRQPLEEVIEVYDGKAWRVIDPVTGEPGLPDRFMLWQRGGRSLFEVDGGTDSAIRLSVIRNVRPLADVAHARDRSGRLSFSVYALPIADQNVFKILSLIPIGALIVCIARNVIGIATSGTFMPLLIALAFQETGMWTGIVIFTIIVAAGLLIRTYLSDLNLLLVPRISAVVVVVIGLMGVLSIVGYQLGYSQGLAVTYFPFIVIAWTIERLSTTWEENGRGDALQQLAGSVGVALAVYLTWQSSVVRHILFAFSEVNLIVLAAILALGTYTGYRLSELRRFNPMVDE